MTIDGFFIDWASEARKFASLRPPMPLVALHMLLLEMAVDLTFGEIPCPRSVLWAEKPRQTGQGLHLGVGNLTGLLPRVRSAAVRQNARPSGRGQGELYKNVYFPYRAPRQTLI